MYRMIAGIFLRVVYFIMLIVLSRVLQMLKPLFQNESIELKHSLKNNRFHLALCYHPSILFGYKILSKCNNINFLDLKIKFISKCVRHNLLKTQKGKELLKKIGIDLHYSKGVEFWFEEAHSPIVPYILPDYDKPKDKKIAVYTALTGDYDNVNEILYKEEGVDYLLFTNNPSVQSNTWKVVLVKSELDNQLLSREIKMLPHKYLDKKYDLSIYIDANAVIYGELSNLSYYCDENISLAITKHSVRNTLKEEFDACVSIKGIDRTVADLQYERYVQDGFVDNIPLVECGLLIRNHHDVDLQKLMMEWYLEYQNGIRRDQLSLLPLISKSHFDRYIVLNGSVWHNQYFKLVSHK